MTRLADNVLARRAVRDAAKARLKLRVDSLRADLAERGLVGRIVDEVAGEAIATFDEAIAVAKDSKGVIAGTIAVLALWFLRNPMISWLQGALGRRGEAEGTGDHEE